MLTGWGRGGSLLKRSCSEPSAFLQTQKLGLASLTEKGPRQRLTLVRHPIPRLRSQPHTSLGPCRALTTGKQDFSQGHVPLGYCPQTLPSRLTGFLKITTPDLASPLTFPTLPSTGFHPSTLSQPHTVTFPHTAQSPLSS